MQFTSKIPGPQTNLKRNISTLEVDYLDTRKKIDSGKEHPGLFKAANLIQEQFELKPQESKKVVPWLFKKPVKLDLTYVPAATKVSLGQQQIILRQMKELIKKATRSETAGIVNGNSKSQSSKYSAQEIIFCNNVINNPAHQDKFNLTLMLKLGFHKKNLLCNDLAIALAIFLRNTPQLPQKLRNKVTVCEVGGHVTCCLGSPKLKSSLVVDPWISYLDLPKLTGYRKHLVKWNDPARESGFMGSVIEYQQFLKDHPNEYIPTGSSLKLMCHYNFTTNSLGIIPAELEAPLTSLEQLAIDTALPISIDSQQSDSD